MRCNEQEPIRPRKGLRGAGVKSALWPMLSAAMEKIDMDPVEFYKKNFVKAGDGYFWRDGKWWV